MDPKKTSKSYLPEVRARAVRMVMDHQGEYASQWAAICSIAAKIGCRHGGCPLHGGAADAPDGFGGRDPGQGGEDDRQQPVGTMPG